MTAALEQHADAAGGEEGDRDRHQQVERQRARQVVVEQRLHRVGGVGADGQHLAVGHVDDAHDAEGDGQPQRGEQEHAGQRQPVDQVAADGDQALPALDCGQRAAAPRACTSGSVSTAVPFGPLAVIRCSSERNASLAVFSTMASAASRASRLLLARSTRATASASASDTPAFCSRASAAAQQRPAPRPSRSWTAPRPPPAAPPDRATPAAAAPSRATPRAGCRCSSLPPSADAAATRSPRR